MATIFISDIHLSSTLPELTNCFIRFIEEQTPHVSQLYILGDLFEAWIGDDDHSPLIDKIIEVLKKLSLKSQVFIMSGNRDFLLGKRFASLCGATLLDDPFVIDLYGVPTLLTHGDLLCVNDHAYQRWRKFSHNPWAQKAFLCLPLAWRKKIAHALRARSETNVKGLMAAAMDVDMTALIAMMNKYQVQHIIHGHTHQPSIHYLFIDGKPMWHYVLSDWHHAPTALIVNVSHSCSLLPPR